MTVNYKVQKKVKVKVRLVDGSFVFGILDITGYTDLTDYIERTTSKAFKLTEAQYPGAVCYVDTIVYINKILTIDPVK